MNMKSEAATSAPLAQLRTLAEFRHQLRMFLQFSESAAQKLGLQPQQHQLLLQIAGAPDGTATTVGYAAERLGVRHNTAVELSGRSEEAGLIKRKHGGDDRRRVLLELTPKGRRLLDSLSVDHALELHELAPQLIRTLTELRTVSGKPGKGTHKLTNES
jgi:DNA-binding MarR family transcriptional regulator